jgi:hypothetical protein
MHQPRVGIEEEDDRPVTGEEFAEIDVAQRRLCHNGQRMPTLRDAGR